MEDLLVDEELRLLRSEYFFIQWLVCDGRGSVPPQAELFWRTSRASAEKLSRLFRRREKQRRFNQKRASFEAEMGA